MKIEIVKKKLLFSKWLKWAVSTVFRSGIKHFSMIG